jgi:type I restriction enzyme S subunit
MKDGWEIKRLGEVSEVIAGQSPSGKHYNSEGIGTPFYQGKKEFGDKFLGSPTTWTTQIKKIAKKGDILMSVRAPVGPVNFTENEICIGRGLASIRCNQRLNKEFLFYQLLLLQKVIAGKEGAVFASISKSEIAALSIAVTTLPEQLRIVGILDEVFDGIATAKANTEKKLANARELLNAYLNSVFSQRGEGWKEKRLGDITDVQSGGTPLVSNKQYWNGNIPWYSSGELNKILTDKSARTITEDGLNNSNAKIFPKGSLLIGMYDTAALKMSILDRDATFNQAIAGVRPNNMIEMEYIFHVINALKPKLLLQRRGARQNNLSLQKIKNILLPIPSLLEQRNIIHTCNQALSETQRLESIYQQKIEALDALKQSILHQAFSGKL